ncbi:Uro-adherence factor A like [Actinidia chinensis var. chinensis]|uniref:Uro-adherence factor A like n=1 Tax=Actinidia chinensis var. chinensis TaxID=1590841 RepID=A0A2R6Q7Z6_ACTCC|nr:Uro-adherence factor A like [Actinidia chinensis var. chinensis]
MSLEEEAVKSPDRAAESFGESKKHSKLAYTREFLLSLSELDVCKKLPSGFDLSVLSEFEDAFQGIQDWPRIHGSVPFQSYRRTDYSSSPPTKGDSSSYSQGIYGKWDSRSSGRIERDTDSQSDWDSDSGRRNSNQSRRSWQSSEHDGLLGSGSFQKPSGYAAELSAPKVRPNDHYQLKKSNEPYHPPRPYKAIPHSRRDTRDSYNDETFGSLECTSHDKAEEERRRRESFELMRKEQQKTLQEQQKLNPIKHKDGRVSDITELLEDNKDGGRVFNKSNDLNDSMTQTVSNDDSHKHTPGSRPLVPPGFRSTILEKICSTRSVTHSHAAEVGRTEIEQSLYHVKGIVQNGTLENQEGTQSAQKMGFRDLQQHEITSIHTQSLNNGEQIVNSSADLEVSYEKLGADNQLYRTSSLSEASETQDGSESVESATKKVTGHKIVNDSKQDQSTTILEKLFGSVSTVNSSESSGFIKHRDTEHDSWSPDAVQSSKFAHWFLEDEKKTAEDPQQVRTSDLLSLIVGGEKCGTQILDVKATNQIRPAFPFQSSELAHNIHLTPNMTSSTIGISDQFFNSSRQEAVPAILTCEDLEQTILSEYTESTSALQVPVERWSSSGAKTQESKAGIDNLASQHLLSLLQKGTGSRDNIESQNLDSGLSENLHTTEGAIAVGTIGNSREEKAENVQHSEKTLTLETLFGSAFMKELQSIEAPVSVQRGSVGSARIDISEPHGLPLEVRGDGVFPTSTVGIGSDRSNHESNVGQSSQRLQSKSNKIENWLGFNDTQVEVDPSNLQNNIVSKLGGFNVAADIQLPGEETLITVGNPVNTPNSMFMSASNATQGEFPSSNKQVNIAEKLATLNTVFKDERLMVGQDGPPFVLHPYDPMDSEIPFRNVHAQPLSYQFPLPQMNHGRPLYHPLDSHATHVSSQMNFMAPERILDHDAPANHQVPENMLHPPFHHPQPGPARFDLPHHSMLQQMQMPGSFRPPHPLQELPRGGLLPPQPSNHATNFMHAQNPIQGLPFGHQRPNVGGIGMQLQAHDISSGNNYPEALQRLLEMERRANSKKTHPLVAADRSQGMYGHELDMGFRYR